MDAMKPNPSLTRRSLLAYPAASLLALPAASMLLAGCDQLKNATGQGAASFKSVDVTGADFGKTLSLPDQHGRVRTLEEFKGKVAVVFFGYTQCPDVCPTTMAELSQIKRAMGADGAKVQSIFVTVDPERDTAALLKAYVENFGPDFVGLRAPDDAQTKLVAQHFKVFYARGKGATPETYTVDHTAGSYLYDPQGRLRLFSKYGMKPEDLTSDIKQLLKGA
jgi:protein SCO1